MWAGFAAYLAFVLAAPRLGRRIVWGAIGLLVVAFTALPPLLSNDIYSYVDYARFGVLHGLDPYVHPPSAVPADPAFAEVEWTEATSAYGPLFTLATYPLAWLPVGVAVHLLKVVAAGSVLGLAVLVARLAPVRGIDPLRAAAFVPLNPLVLVHVVGGGHNDGLAMLLAMGGAGAILAGRAASAGASLVGAVAVKASTAFIAPFTLLATVELRSKPPKPIHGMGNRQFEVARLLIGAALAAVAIGLASWLAFGWSWLDALGLAGENQGRTSHLSIPITFARIAGVDPDPVRIAALALYAAVVAYLLVWTWRGGDWVRAAAWAGFGLLLATAWLLPWYLIWPLPLVALSRDRMLQLLLLALTAYQLGARIPL